MTVDGGTTWVNHDFTAGGNTRDVYTAAAFLLAFRGAGGHAAATLAGDAANHITDANVANFRKHSPDNTRHLTGAQAGAAYNNG